MKKITLTIDTWINPELQEYLYTINGINKVELSIDDDEITIEYDSTLITQKLLLMEILLFLDIGNKPSLISFNKYSQEDLAEYTLIVKDNCCEYCINSNVEELFEIEGIEKVSTDYNFKDVYNINYSIKYNDKIININKLKEIEKKFNTYE